jgi:hypothetical protein
VRLRRCLCLGSCVSSEDKDEFVKVIGNALFLAPSGGFPGEYSRVLKVSNRVEPYAVHWSLSYFLMSDCSGRKE